MSEPGQDGKSLIPRNPISPVVRADVNRMPSQVIDWEEAMKKVSSFDVTKIALDAAKGSTRVPEATLPGLMVNTARNASAVVRYGLYAIEAASLYYEHRDGFIDDDAARKRAEEITTFYEKAQDGRNPYDTYFREEAKKNKTQIPEELDRILKDPKKLRDKYQS